MPDQAPKEQPKKRATRSRKKEPEAQAKPNGKATAEDSKVSSLDEARKKREDGPPPVWDRAPSDTEIENAKKVLAHLDANAQDMGPEAVIDALVQIVDVHPDFRMPSSWPDKSEVTLVEAPLLSRIGKLMLRGCPKVEVSPLKVRFLWRNKKTWTKRGVAVHAQAKKLSEVGRFFANGAVAAVVGNFQLFRLLNTRQKLRAIYHSLRELDAEGVIRPPQFEGFFDEITLFGTGTNQTDAHLRRAMERGGERDLPFEEHPSLFDDPEEAGEESSATANA